MLFGAITLSSLSCSQCLSLFLFLSESETPQYTLAPHTRCGRCWCEKAPLLNSDSLCTIIPPPPQLHHSPPSPCTPTTPLYYSECVSLSILYPCILSLREKLGGHFRQRMKNENWGSENANTHLIPSLRPDGAAGKVARMKRRYILYSVYLNFRRANNFSIVNSGWKHFFSSKPTLGHQYLKTMLEEHQKNIRTTRAHPC